jgi:hypothetical protein
VGLSMSDQCVNKVCSIVQECSGVCNVIGVLDEETRKMLLDLETKEEGNMTQLGATQENQGMKDVLSRDVVILVVNDKIRIQRSNHYS